LLPQLLDFLLQRADTGALPGLAAVSSRASASSPPSSWP
jgi:hypothetical protein